MVLVAPPLPLELNDLLIPTLINYADAMWKGEYYTQRVFNYHVGCLDRSNQLKYEWCWEGFRCGGVCLGEDSKPPYLRTFLPPDLTYPPVAAAVDPARAYPAPTFNGYGLGGGTQGSLYNTREPQQGLLYSPFVDPAAIERGDSPEARQQDARRQGGYTATRSADAVARSETWVNCPDPDNFLYFDDYCWWKINEEVYPQAISTLANFPSICATSPVIINVLGTALAASLAAPAITLDEATREWLLNFVLFNPQPTAYVLPGGGCVGARLESGTWVSELTECPAYGLPLCVFHAHTAVEVRGVFQEIPRETLDILRNGQPGIP